MQQESALLEAGCNVLKEALSCGEGLATQVWQARKQRPTLEIHPFETSVTA